MPTRKCSRSRPRLTRQNKGGGETRFTRRTTQLLASFVPRVDRTERWRRDPRGRGTGRRRPSPPRCRTSGLPWPLDELPGRRRRRPGRRRRAWDHSCEFCPTSWREADHSGDDYDLPTDVRYLSRYLHYVALRCVELCCSCAVFLVVAPLGHF